MTKGCVTFEDGKNEYSEGTFDCAPYYGGCIYQVNGRCCFNVTTLKIHHVRACYDIANDFDGNELNIF